LNPQNPIRVLPSEKEFRRESSLGGWHPNRIFFKERGDEGFPLIQDWVFLFLHINIILTKFLNQVNLLTLSYFNDKIKYNGLVFKFTSFYGVDALCNASKETIDI